MKSNFLKLCLQIIITGTVNYTKELQKRQWNKLFRHELHEFTRIVLLQNHL